VAEIRGGAFLIQAYKNKCLNSGGDYFEKLLKYVYILCIYEILFSLVVLLTAHQRLHPHIYKTTTLTNATQTEQTPTTYNLHREKKQSMDH
jgi:hypothetical protein